MLEIYSPISYPLSSGIASARPSRWPIIFALEIQMSTSVPSAPLSFMTNMNALAPGVTSGLGIRDLLAEYNAAAMAPINGVSIMEYTLLIDDLRLAASSLRITPFPVAWEPNASSTTTEDTPAVPANPLGGRPLPALVPEMATMFPDAAGNAITREKQCQVDAAQRRHHVICTADARLKMALEAALDATWLQSLRTRLPDGVTPHYAFWSAKELMHAALARHRTLTAADIAAIQARVRAPFSASALTDGVSLAAAIRLRQRTLERLPAGYAQSFPAVRDDFAAALSATPAGKALLSVHDLAHPRAQSFDTLVAIVEDHYDMQLQRATADAAAANAALPAPPAAGSAAAAAPPRRGPARAPAGPSSDAEPCYAWAYTGDCPAGSKCRRPHPPGKKGSMAHILDRLGRLSLLPAAAPHASPASHKGYGKSRASSPRQRSGAAHALGSDDDDA